jgi:hypothetical protein
VSAEGPGEPISYLALREGTPVASSDGERIGEVKHVLAEPEEDIFDGIVIDASWLLGGHAFADATLIDEIRSGQVRLNIDAAESRSLPEPSANPAALDTGPEDTVKEDVGDEMRDKLRRAWDLISGNY